MPFVWRGFRRPNFTATPDEAYDDLMPELSGAEWKVVSYIIRRTYGFKRDADNISLAQMASGIVTRDGRRLDGGTGLDQTTVSAAVRSLIEKQVILKVRRSSKEHGDLPTTYRLRMAEEPVRENPLPPALPVRENPLPLSGNTPDPRQGKSLTQETGEDNNTGRETGADPAQVLWQQVLNQLASQVTRPIFETYLRGTRGVAYSQDQLVVAAGPFARDWLERKLRLTVMQVLAEVVGQTVDVVFWLEEEGGEAHG